MSLPTCSAGRPLIEDGPLTDSEGSAGPDRITSYSYDTNGNLTAFRKRDGVTLAHSYDSRDQRTSSVIPNEWWRKPNGEFNSARN
ncbi:RHS repeat domain-containing protein [Pseudidiomarina piscicola]|uniref:RHS repeat domain-containing protein n=1 Tax=Pseudidiomarina piscicola TaxID=2614830 RepID=UPI0015714E10|nr:RHS repeat domain-containing protein [Pseudidiomarina piscicola]